MFIKRLPTFEYHAPATIEEALHLITRYGDNGRFMAGGTDLLVAMKKREITPLHLISLNGIAALKGITLDKKGGVKIGALTTLAEIERSDIIQRQFFPLRDAIDVMASAQVRSLATIGGNLCSAVPSADTAPPLIALNASLKLVGQEGERSILVEEFFTGPKETVRKSTEILTAIMIPKPEVLSSGCYLKLMRRHAMDLAIVGVAAYLKLDREKKTCTEARIALGAVAPTPIRVPEVEALLANKAIDEKLITEAARLAGMQCRPISDIRSSLEYRCRMVEVLTRRAVKEAYRRITA
jgi:carbon-monoxide dehydrogenase medium subunit